MRSGPYKVRALGQNTCRGLLPEYMLWFAPFAPFGANRGFQKILLRYLRTGQKRSLEQPFGCLMPADDSRTLQPICKALDKQGIIPPPLISTLTLGRRDDRDYLPWRANGAQSKDRCLYTTNFNSGAGKMILTIELTPNPRIDILTPRICYCSYYSVTK